MTGISWNAGSESRLFMTADRASDIARCDIFSPEYHHRPFPRDTLYGRRACMTGISCTGGSEFRLFMTADRASDIARAPER